MESASSTPGSETAGCTANRSTEHERPASRTRRSGIRRSDRDRSGARRVRRKEASNGGDEVGLVERLLQKVRGLTRTLGQTETGHQDYGNRRELGAESVH